MKKKINSSYIHFIIGMIIMLGFRFVPMGVLPNVTKSDYKLWGYLLELFICGLQLILQ